MIRQTITRQVVRFASSSYHGYKPPQPKPLKVPPGLLALGITAAVGSTFYLTSPPPSYSSHQLGDEGTDDVRHDVWISSNPDERRRLGHGKLSKLVHKVKDAVEHKVQEVIAEQGDIVEDVLEEAAREIVEETVGVPVEKEEITGASQQSLSGQSENSQQSGSVVHTPTKASPYDDMIECQYLLIGGGTASFSAMKSIYQQDPQARILIVSAESQIPYMRPPLSKELWQGEKSQSDVSAIKFKDWGGTERSLYFEDASSYSVVKPIDSVEYQNADDGTPKPMIMLNTTVQDLNVDTHLAKLNTGRFIKYDKVLIATGGSAKLVKQLPVEFQNRVSTFRTVDDYMRLADIIQSGKKRIMIVGGGFLGSELACGVARFGRKYQTKVTQVMPENGNMGLVLPKYLVKWTTEKVRAEGVDVLPDVYIKGAKLINSKQQIEVELDNGKTVQADHVVVCVGIDANVSLARKAGLEIDKVHGGIVVNDQLEARRNVFVAGDVASFHDITLGRRRIEHHDHAILSGRIAGRNMAVKEDRKRKSYKHQSMFWSDLGPNIGYEAVGILDSKLKTVGLWAKQKKVDTPKQVVSVDTKEQHNVRVTSPEDLVEASPDTVVAKTEADFKQDENADDQSVTPQNSSSIGGEEYGKGVVLYLDPEDGKIVGVLLWNLFNRTNIARRLIAEKKTIQDIRNLASLFKIHDN
ncbi:hypothetical protein MP228_002369 [Amoeboaphelidium protococcarum]|nr:hypothetical protein MP228_002369 [Amoeboaphelidium protococcarum]